MFVKENEKFFRQFEPFLTHINEFNHNLLIFIFTFKIGKTSIGSFCTDSIYHMHFYRIG